VVRGGGGGYCTWLTIDTAACPATGAGSAAGVSRWVHSNMQGEGLFLHLLAAGDHACNATGNCGAAVVSMPVHIVYRAVQRGKKSYNVQPHWLLATLHALLPVEARNPSEPCNLQSCTVNSWAAAAASSVWCRC
jgi:hypothetical protein